MDKMQRQSFHQLYAKLTYHRNFNEHLKLDIGYELDALQTDLNFHDFILDGNEFL